MSVAIAVGVSGQGTNLAALRAVESRGLLGGRLRLVFADRPCPALEAAAAAGLPTLLLGPEPWDEALAQALGEAGIELIALAGFMRRIGPQVLAGWPDRLLNVHPSLLPAFPGAHAVRDALAAGVALTGVTVHLVDAQLDGGPIVLQEPVAVRPDDDEAGLAARLHTVEHRLLPRAVALLAGGALRREGRRVILDPARAANLPAPRRALLSVSDKTGLLDFARGLADLGFELVSTGGTARALRDGGLAVVDVAAVTGFPEMLDGRVKTLHPRIHAGILADRRLADHAVQLAEAGIEPFDLVAVNLYPFAEAARRSDLDLDGLIEQIDIGGPSLVRAAAKNHASLAVVVEPAAYPQVLAELRRDGSLGETTRRRLAATAFAHTAAYDAHIATVLPARLGLAEKGSEEGSPGPIGPAEGDGAPFPERIDLGLRRLGTLRYGENPHQRAAVYRDPGAAPASGPFAAGLDPLQGKPLSYNNLLDAAAAAALARDLHGPACAVIKHGNPCGAAEADDLLTAWEQALAGDPVSAFGGVVALTGPLDAALAERLTSVFLEVVLAPEVTAEARPVLARKPALRVLVDPGLGQPPQAHVELRSAGGAILATEADVAPDDPAAWQTVTRRAPEAQELADLDFCWRVCRHVASNAIVLARQGRVVGVGAGQMSRVDSAHLAVEKAGPEQAQGAVCASDAFFPFADALEVCLTAGATACVQPGGSVRDAEVIAAADAAGAAMVLTGRRHFRH
ncbi:MAG TPA: bifunctional phosphoribosylaminoimidazolecarboxamide formyltransferase/IMP cyclohydrolase [Candidatus Limnocylindrales bacterium]|nr:bifunctional phosphoribosylaminoimidazolecarboxamide formyltransferase/IMP cyclohydrolase [Candidatus Limnocylindrales bacterium]